MRRVTVSAPRDPWGALFPVEEAQRATQFLVDTWHTVTDKAPENFDRRRNEPLLTEQFWWYLDRLGESEGKLLGQWSYEKPRFEYLKYALALVLVFIGSKIFLVNITGKFPSWVSLSVTVGLIAGGVVFSWLKTRKSAVTPTGGV